MVFESIADSFRLIDYMEQTYPKPTIHWCHSSQRNNDATYGPSTLT
jgi:hypothetical protein